MIEYAEHIKEARSAARVMVPRLCEYYHPARVLDVGCMCGAWCAEFVGRGVKRVDGCDGSWIPTKQLIQPKAWTFLPIDLNKDRLVDVYDQYDLVLCLEVAEHLKYEKQELLVADLCQTSDVVIWSAATPEQGYASSRSELIWIEMFNAMGFKASKWLRRLIDGDSRCRFWYQQNILEFEKR